MKYQPDLYDHSRKIEAISLVSCGHEYSQQFRRWLEKNFFIYLAFERRALRLIRSGHQHCGAMMIINNIRWQSMLAEAESQYKIRNDVQPDLARLFHAMNPKHDGFFRLRVRKVAA